MAENLYRCIYDIVLLLVAVHNWTNLSKKGYVYPTNENYLIITYFKFG